jgi:pimeloyl-ACP methyl ester carboxylesterase
VFVHGLFGDPLESWRSQSGPYFFELMHDDFPAKEYAVYAFGYPSTAFGPAFSITETVQALHSRLQADRVFQNHQSVLFVAHSMGGLVVQEFLLTYRIDPNKVPLLFQFSTPHEGSEIAKIARHVARNRALETLIPGDANEYLRNLDVRWKAAVSNGALKDVLEATTAATMAESDVKLRRDDRDLHQSRSSIPNRDLRLFDARFAPIAIRYVRRWSRLLGAITSVPRSTPPQSDRH